MDNAYSPNYTEYTYDKKAEGRLLLARVAFVSLYVLFAVVYFLFCYITRFIPVFALCPIFLWILVFFTWRYVKFDVYYVFEHGNIEIGKVRRVKKKNKRLPQLSVNYKNVLSVRPYLSSTHDGDLKDVARVYDFSGTLSSDKNIVIAFKSKNGTEAVIVESTPALVRLLKSYLKEKCECT